MERLLSGIQPSGELHIGNYLGAVKNWVALQDEYEAFFCAVDLHAATVEYDAAEMQPRLRDLVATLMACGLGGGKSRLFVQSHVPEHTMLAWLFNCVTPLGELERMTQFKTKSEQHHDNINAGLLTYPILQAADILIYKASVVPVGEDQVQHVELTREVARKFNGRFGAVFPEPKALLTGTARIRGLDGTGKMSKSMNNHLPLLATPEKRWELLRPAFTDPARIRRSDPGTPETCNIFAMHQGFSAAGTVATIDRDCRTAGIGCVDCKRLLAGHMEEVLGPVRERFLVIGDGDVDAEVEAGAAAARAIASATLAEAMKAMGLTI